MVKLKHSGVSLNIKGFGQINDGNITDELAKRIIEAHPSLSEHFVFEEVKEEKKGK
jgi:folate-dependent phosphoribosylglycinamide formyltransferase PurN